jgi:hypothetical protein
MSLGVWLVGCLGTFALLGSAGCDGHAVCTADCTAAGAVIVQSASMSPVVSLTADAPCTVSVVPVDGGSQVIVGVNEGNPAHSGTCSVHETLSDGTELVATLGWARNGGTGCCANTTHNVGPMPTFTRTDGGAP